MPTVVTCPHCGTYGRLPDDLAEGTLACPKCGEQFAVTDGRPPAGPVPDGDAVWLGPLDQASPAPPNTPAPLLATAVTPDTAEAHLAWVQEEVRRFDAYVAEQVARIGKQREDLVRAETAAAANSVAREMTVNRDKAVVAARAAALDQREAELAARLEALERREAEVERAERAIERRLAELAEVEEGVREESHAAKVEHVRQVLTGVPAKIHGCA